MSKTAVLETTFESSNFDREIDSVILQRYNQHIKPFWQNKVANGLFGGENGVSIHYAYIVHPNPVNTVVISSGRIESLVKYKELVYNLYHAGYSVFIHDHRGQGLSGRMTANPHQGYVDHFDDYVADLKTFFDKVVSPKSATQPKLLCHSMGSAIGALYLIKYPKDFSQAVFSAPMFGIKPALPNWFARGLIKIQFVLEKSFSTHPCYFWGQGNYNPDDFASNSLTHSESRYLIFRQEYEENPQLKLGGITIKWLSCALDAIEFIERNASKIETPSLVLQAGADEIVDNAKQDKVCQSIKRLKKVRIEGAKHELLMEMDEYRDICLKSLLQFFDTNQ